MHATLRLATEQDAPAIADIYAYNIEETHFSFETVSPSTAEMATRIRTTVAQFPWLVCEIADDVVGYAYATARNERQAYQWAVDTSVYVAKAWHRHNIARGLYTALFELLRLQGYYTAYAVIALPNPASVRLHESFGFNRVGLYEQVGFKNGEWHDVGHWELRLQSRETPPQSPEPISEIRGSDEWNRALTAGAEQIR